MNETIYTLGVWTLKTAQEQQFIQSWSEFAAWTNAAIEGPGTAILLRDKANPSFQGARFAEISSFAWSEKAV